MQLIVTKCDGSAEVYRHTKVMGAIALALGMCGSYPEGVIESLAEAVTAYIARRYGASTVSSDEIYCMIEAVLVETGYGQAALALQELLFGPAKQAHQ